MTSPDIGLHDLVSFTSVHNAKHCMNDFFIKYEGYSESNDGKPRKFS